MAIKQVKLGDLPQSEMKVIMVQHYNRKLYWDALLTGLYRLRLIY